jgi:hypothetical protein
VTFAVPERAEEAPGSRADDDPGEQERRGTRDRPGAAAHGEDGVRRRVLALCGLAAHRHSTPDGETSRNGRSAGRAKDRTRKREIAVENDGVDEAGSPSNRTDGAPARSARDRRTTPSDCVLGVTGPQAVDHQVQVPFSCQLVVTGVVAVRRGRTVRRSGSPG